MRRGTAYFFFFVCINDFDQKKFIDIQQHYKWFLVANWMEIVLLGRHFFTFSFLKNLHGKTKQKTAK